jgi:hypothetical protein
MRIAGCVWFPYAPDQPDGGLAAANIIVFTGVWDDLDALVAKIGTRFPGKQVGCSFWPCPLPATRIWHEKQR